ncbi:MAG: very short patch repair endonuclease [Spirochaetaceae bacterium]|jgi:DNA mismatch endonuclease (patch repair protein)|nr:very short patch repair endonuclease [Spirochaetaceae bacterium]
MDNLTPEQRKKAMAAVHSKNTKPEILIRKALFALGYRYRIDYKKLPGRPDLALPKYHAVVFVHGCFWHGHSGCPNSKLPQSNKEYWTLKIDRNRKRDGESLNHLHAIGWRVCIVWECAIQGKNKKMKIERAALTISDWLQNGGVWLEISSATQREM